MGVMGESPQFLLPVTLKYDLQKMTKYMKEEKMILEWTRLGVKVSMCQKQKLNVKVTGDP